jgi:hypothetical protein
LTSKTTVLLDAVLAYISVPSSSLWGATLSWLEEISGVDADTAL